MRRVTAAPGSYSRLLHNRGRASEHAVAVGRCRRYVLDDVPVLDDLAILEAEEVYKRSARLFRIVGFEIDIRMAAARSPSAMTRLMSNLMFGYRSRSRCTPRMNSSGPSAKTSRIISSQPFRGSFR